MRKADINQILAANLQVAMKRKFNDEVNQSALARLSKVSQKTISNILSALKPEDERTPPPSPTLAKLDQIAEALGVRIWELLYPTIERVRLVKPAKNGSSPEANEVAELATIFATCNESDRKLILRFARDIKRVRESVDGSSAENES